MKLSKLILNPHDSVFWTDGGERYSGQFWAEGAEPCSLWVVPYDRQGLGRVFIQVFRAGSGHYTTDKAAAAQGRKTPLVTAELF